MIIIGERINSTRKSIKEAIDKKDLEFLIEEARKQASCGAGFIDVNCAAGMEKESDNLNWLIANIQQRLGCKISIDSPNLDIIKTALKIHKATPFINSLTAEKEKLDFLPNFTNANVIVLAIDEAGIPRNSDDRITLAEKIIDTASKKGIDKKNIYIDPLVKPISTEPKQACYFLEALKRLKDKGINTIGGLSNVSFGLPKRGLLNAVFLKLAIDAGIGGAIIDPTNDTIKKVLRKNQLPQEPFDLAKKALLGEDDYSMSYIRAFRAGAFDSF